LIKTEKGEKNKGGRKGKQIIFAVIFMSNKRIRYEHNGDNQNKTQQEKLENRKRVFLKNLTVEMCFFFEIQEFVGSFAKTEEK
jgi:hypothetical protein